MGKNNLESVIVEIRPGAGGEEAAKFVKDLFKMYSGYAKKHGWGLKTLNMETTSLNGLKEVVFELRGEKAYTLMKNEAGVHRIQRVPETESKGRIHTSTATVVVLKKTNAKQAKLKRSDVEIESYRASGPGGQYTNKTETAVRVTHKPTGLTINCQSARSQHKNKVNAIRILQAKLVEEKKKKLRQKKEKKRKNQMGGGKRSFKIRTYNFPQNRVTDHRLEKTWHNLEEILEGNLDPIIKNFS